jgi:DNA processing protein
MTKLHALLTALKLPGIGPGTIRKYIQSGASPLGLGDGPLHQVEALLSKASPEDLRRARDEAEKTLERCNSLGLLVRSAVDPDYPRKLRDLNDYPIVLYVRGDIAALSYPLFAIVGTREPSLVGERYATRLARELVTLGGGVVSGLARGIDRAAHEGALKANGVTVAVLAHGLHMVTPKSNSDLAEWIVEGGGALVSEHEPGVPPRRAEFVRRNRIQSGLALASIILESGEVGGAMHQAKFTRDQKRKLYAFVPPFDAPGAAQFKRGGAEKLVQELGAGVISSMDDLRKAWQDAGNAVIG